MKPTVYTYFIPDPALVGRFGRILEMWVKAWREAGFYPRIMGCTPVHHPLYADVLRHVRTLPSVNSRQYTENDFIRWLAMEETGGGLHVDSDVFPKPGTEIDLSEIHNHAGDEPLCLDQYRCPCAVYLSPAAAKRHVISKRILSYKDPDARGHCSDQGMFCRTDWPVRHLCSEPDHPGFKDSPMQHWSSRFVGSEGDKAGCIVAAMAKIA